VEFSERSPREVEVRAVQKRRLFRAQAGVIEGPEHRIVTGGGCVLAGGGDPGLEEVEELRDPLGGRRRQLSWGIIPDVPGRVELIDRANQADAEPRFDLDSLADLQEPVEPLKICTYSRRVEAARPARARSPTTRSMSSGVTSQAGRPSAVSVRSSSPMSFSTVTGLNPRACHEATNASTQSA
jgi:hypothetical protein